MAVHFSFLAISRPNASLIYISSPYFKALESVY